MNFFNETLIMPGDWIPIAQRILHHEETVMVLGRTDSGKTSLIRLFVQYLIKRNRKIAVIDADIGQSTLGPPGTVGLCVLDNQHLQSRIIPVDYTVFVGAISPERCTENFVKSVCRLNRICQQEVIDKVLIDTTGLISGSLGVYLKSILIKKISPSLLIALQWNDELEPILREFENDNSIQIFRLKPYQNIKKKDWRERKERRRKQFRSYFQGSILRDIDFSSIPLRGVFSGGAKLWEQKEIEQINQRYRTEIISVEKANSKMILIIESQQNIPDQEIIADIKKHYSVQQIIIITQPWFKSLLISFNNQDNQSDGLGIISEIRFQQKKITAYVQDKVLLKATAQIEIGQLKISPDGMELLYEEPEEY
jgi:polynucleotide 5'-hydroxyl-kinase GRC3/NOL9